MTTIAVLFHEFQRNHTRYVVHHLAEIWRQDGLKVEYLFGIRRFQPADLLLVHVDLSVVPPEYLEFAGRYPIALNKRLSDVRKSRISTHLLRPDDPWEGPVIVKSDLNFAGQPEKSIGGSRLEQRWPLLKRVRAAIVRRFSNDSPFSKGSHYQVYADLSEIPANWFSARDVVVEKFLPEMEGGLYHLRIHQALGDREICTRLASDNPIIKAGKSVSAVDIAPHPEVAAWRKDFGVDYGKLDYVVVDGKAILLDVNKTIGATSSYRGSDDLLRHRKYLAQGIYSFLS